MALSGLLDETLTELFRAYL